MAACCRGLPANAFEYSSEVVKSCCLLGCATGPSGVLQPSLAVTEVWMAGRLSLK